MKGHKERLMLYPKEHLKALDEQSIGEAYICYRRSGRNSSAYATSGRFSIPFMLQSGSLAPSRFRPGQECLGLRTDSQTPRMIIDNKEGTISRANPDKDSPKSIVEGLYFIPIDGLFVAFQSFRRAGLLHSCRLVRGCIHLGNTG